MFVEKISFAVSGSAEQRGFLIGGVHPLYNVEPAAIVGLGSNR